MALYAEYSSLVKQAKYAAVATDLDLISTEAVETNAAVQVESRPQKVSTTSRSISMQPHKATGREDSPLTKLEKRRVETEALSETISTNQILAHLLVHGPRPSSGPKCRTLIAQVRFVFHIRLDRDGPGLPLALGNAEYGV